MNENILSKDEGFELLEKLRVDKTPILALFELFPRVRVRVIGSIFRVLRDDNLLISTSDHPSAASAFLRVALDRPLAFAAGDTRDCTDLVSEDLVIEFGNKVLLIRFTEPEEFLIFTFTG